MYIVQGRLKTKPAPETLLGKYGLYKPYRPHIRSLAPGVELSRGTSASFVGTEEEVQRRARRLGAFMGRPEDLIVEQITDVSQTHKYLEHMGATVHGIGHETRKRPANLAADMEARVPEGYQLLTGQASLWHERRIPTPYVYVAALGSLLEDLVYTQETGWERQPVAGERVDLGLYMPGLSFGMTVSESGRQG